VKSKYIASGGVGESSGAVVLIIEEETKDVKKAISLIESIKGEPTLRDFKDTCEKCLYFCNVARKKMDQLQEWLRD
jgi:hypothetical protein